MQRHEFEAIGTQWSIETTHVLTRAIIDEIDARIELFDQTYSRFRSDSTATKLRRPGHYEFPADSQMLLELYRELHDVTDGAVTPLIGEALEQAGYDANYSLVQKTQPKKIPEWDDVMVWDKTRVTVKQPIVFDVGAAGKGYLVDLIAEILTSHNIDQYVIDASGDVRHHGVSPEHIGLENPFNIAEVVGVATLQNASLCASASNRRAWGDEWHHIIDPRTSQPVRDVVATWVVADSTMVADGLATALFFVPPTVLASWEFQAVRMFSDGRVEYTSDFVGELFI